MLAVMVASYEVRLADHRDERMDQLKIRFDQGISVGVHMRKRSELTGVGRILQSVLRREFEDALLVEIVSVDLVQLL